MPFVDNAIARWAGGTAPDPGGRRLELTNAIVWVPTLFPEA